MTNEERIKIGEMVGQQHKLIEKQQRDARLDLKHHNGLPKGCNTCRYWDGWNAESAECLNPVVNLHHGTTWIDRGLRRADGLCGPDALYRRGPKFHQLMRWYRLILQNIKGL